MLGKVHFHQKKKFQYCSYSTLLVSYHIIYTKEFSEYIKLTLSFQGDCKSIRHSFCTFNSLLVLAYQYRLFIIPLK